MILGNIDNSPVRSVKGKVELYEGSTLLNTFSYRDRLKSFTVERVGEESKFFGFGVCQKINIKLIDKDRELAITTANSFKAFLTTGEDYIKAFPTFHVTEVHRDENTNELSITAYDALYWASGITFKSKELIEQLGEGEALELNMYAIAVASELGLPPKMLSAGGVSIPLPPLETVGFGEDTIFGLTYPEGANLEGTESLKEVADDIAEATQSIYYIDEEDTLIFKRLDRDGEAKLMITKADYIKLDSKTNRRLVAICHATELGDNVEASLTIQGTTQYVRDNAFWEMREDIDTLVENALAAIGGLTINQFDCSWRGNFLLEPGDKIDLITKDNETVTTYLLNDSITYNGFLSQKTSWKYEESTGESANNPTTIGESIKQTYARVDKQNKEITLLASDVKANSDNISTLTLNSEEIVGKVTSVEEAANAAIDNINGSLDTLTKTVEAKITDEEVNIKINEALSNGVDKVETSTGFTFNEVGLTISKSDSDISTLIDEDGMDISIGDEVVLAADNSGVNAVNLTARQFLVIGKNSRFEDYPPDTKKRTACFWIGG